MSKIYGSLEIKKHLTVDGVIDGILSIVEETDDTTAPGQALYMKSNGRLGLAKATSGLYNIVGLSYSTYTATNTALCIISGPLQLTNWTSVIGSSTLNVGSVYYLDPSTAGHLTTTAPTTVGQYVVEVGTATASDTLNVEIKCKILL